MRHSKYAHLFRLCLWFVAILGPLTVITGVHQYDLLFHPYDLNQLSEDEVLPSEHRSGRQRYAVKLESLVNRPRLDIMITGNHVMRIFQGTDKFENLNFFNFIVDHPSIFQELDLLKALKQVDRLPKKLMIYSLVAHGGKSRLLNREPLLFSSGNTEPPFNLTSKNLGGELLWFFGYETYLDALFSVFRDDIVIDFTQCAQAYAAAKNKKNDFWLATRLKVSEYFPGNITLNSGLLSEDEYCRSDRNFKAISTYALARNGGYLARSDFEMEYDPGDTYPILTPDEAEAGAKEGARGIQMLEKFARENGIRMVYLIPPRYQIPLNDRDDEVANQIFERNPDFTVIDFRRYSLDKKYFADNTHLSAEFGEILVPCLEKILDSKSPLPSRPAVGSRGRTVC